MEKRGGALIDPDRDILAQRMAAYLDKDVSWNVVKLQGNVLAKKRPATIPKRHESELFKGKATAPNKS